MATNSELAEIVRQWTPESYVTYYNWLHAAENPNTVITFPDHLYPLVLALCDTRIQKLMLQVGPGSSKSTSISQVYPSWLLGHDPTATIMTISGAEALAQSFVSSVMNAVEYNTAFRQSFPNVKPDKPAGWSLGRGMFVTGYLKSQPDASYNAFGLSSKALTGQHAKTIILDDLHDSDNSATMEQCEKVFNKYTTQLVGRADPAGARFILAGRRWSTNDLYGKLERGGDWVTLRLPAERPNSTWLYHDVYVPDFTFDGKPFDCVFTDGHCLLGDGTMYKVHEGRLPPKAVLDKTKMPMSHIRWPYGKDPKGQGFFWPASEPKRREYFTSKLLNPLATRAVYQCDPRASEVSIFTREDFTTLFEAPEDLAEGPNNSLDVRMMCKEASVIVQAWDTAFSASSSSDYTVCVTALLLYSDSYRNGEDPAVFGPCEPYYIVRILDIKRQKLNFAEVTREIKSEYLKWGAHAVVIENKAYAVGAIELLRNSGIPIEAVTPDASKRIRAIEGLGAGSAQGWFRQKRVELPHEAEWLEPFIEEMCAFSGEVGGRDDQVDAVIHLVRYAITSGSGGALPSGWSTPEEVNARMSPENALGVALSENVINPFGDMCMHCAFFDTPTSFCNKHRQPTVAIGTCPDHRVSSETPKGDVYPNLAGLRIF